MTIQILNLTSFILLYTAVSTKVVQLKHQSVRDNTERHDRLWLFTVASSSSQVFSVMEGSAMNTCLHVLKEIKWTLSFLTCLLKFIEYFPDYLSVLSRTFLRFFFFGRPLLKQLYTTKFVKGFP